MLILRTASILVLIIGEASAFVPTFGVTRPASIFSSTSTTSLSATGGKKKRRRRKKPLSAPTSDPIKVSQEQIEGLEESGAVEPPAVEDAAKFELKADAAIVPPREATSVSEAIDETVDLQQMKDIASFEFKGSDITKGVEDEQKTEEESRTDDSVSIPLPDIKEVLKKKEIEQEMARIEEEIEMSKPKIKRSDKDAFTRLLEQQPFADADDSFFEEEEYSTVSALLGERAEKFLGIPSGPLQVGHFIGALGIVLMAFIEYPGFPLTNLPTPLRDALQGGLFTVYLINTVLAVLAVFKAQERGQPVPLWVAKTFSVGGLAFDQLNQLPTLEAIEKAKSVKGARALKNRKR